MSLAALRARYPGAQTITLQLNGPTLVDGRAVRHQLCERPPRPASDPLLVIASGWRQW